jgi:hypothetical protein
LVRSVEAFDTSLGTAHVKTDATFAEAALRFWEEIVHPRVEADRRQIEAWNAAPAG